MMLLFDSSTLYLEISDELHNIVWQQSQPGRTAGDRWQTYLNQVCLEAVQSWLQEKFGAGVTQAEPATQPEFWSLLNGCALNLGETRLILVPTEAIDRLELRVPQEWVDLSSWVGDYYLAVEVDPEERWVNIWGYTTHQKLKTMGEYDVSDRTYSLSSNELITDLNVLWVMYQLTTETTRVAVDRLLPLAVAQAEAALNQLESAVIPRLALPFAEWGALIEQANWRQQLYTRRQTQQALLLTQTNTQSTQTSAISLTTLSQWLQNTFEAGWQTVESLLGTDFSPELAFSLRQETTEAAIARRVKRVALQPETPESNEIALLLLLLVTPEADDRLAIRVRLLPNTGETLLPAQVNLNLLAAEGDQVLQSVQSRDRDNSIQLRQFRCAPGTPFRIQIVLGEAIALEDFVV